VVADPASFRRGGLVRTGDQRTISDAVGPLLGSWMNRGNPSLRIGTSAPPKP